jgi:hypothetical protein
MGSFGSRRSSDGRFIRAMHRGELFAARRAL